MSKLILTGLMIIVFFAGCQKYHKQPSDLAGDLYIHGRAFYVEDITTAGIVNVLSNSTFYIGYKKDSALNFITQVKSDVNGYFVFANLASADYVIFTDTTIASVKYTLRKYFTLAASVDTSSLFLTTALKNQNGVVYTVNDPSATGPVSNVTVCLFGNTGFINDSCAGSNYSQISNPVGKAFFLNIAAGAYTAVFYYKVGTVTYKGRDALTIKNDSIGRKAITIKP